MKRDTTGGALPLSGYQVFVTSDVDKIAPATRRITAEHKRRILGVIPEENLVFQPRIDLGTPIGRSLKGLFDFLISDLDHPDSHLKDSPAFQVALVRSLATLLISGLRHNFSERLETGNPVSGLDRVHRIEGYLRDHLGEHLTLDDLADEACVSKRALQKDFRRYRGYSPGTARARLPWTRIEKRDPAAVGQWYGCPREIRLLSGCGPTQEQDFPDRNRICLYLRHSG